MVPPTAAGPAVHISQVWFGGPAGPPNYCFGVTRPTRFEHNRYVGDKRSRVVHDLDAATDACRIDDLLASEQFAAFGPDSLAEARNRGYWPHPACTASTVTEA